jgi:hypothetical protein
MWGTKKGPDKKERRKGKKKREKAKEEGSRREQRKRGSTLLTIPSRAETAGRGGMLTGWRFGDSMLDLEVCAFYYLPGTKPAARVALAMFGSGGTLPFHLDCLR